MGTTEWEKNQAKLLINYKVGLVVIFVSFPDSTVAMRIRRKMRSSARNA